MTPAISRYKRSRFWAVHDAAGVLVCVCVYKRGALEVARRLDGTHPFSVHNNKHNTSHEQHEEQHPHP